MVDVNQMNFNVRMEDVSILPTSVTAKMIVPTFQMKLHAVSAKIRTLLYGTSA